MMQRVSGSVLIVLGGFQAFLSARNLVTLKQASDDLESVFPSEVRQFVSSSENPLDGLWAENIIVLGVMVLAVVIGIVLLVRSTRPQLS